LMTSAMLAQALPAAAQAGHATAFASSNSCRHGDIRLGSAENFSVLGATTVTNTGATLVRGNLGVSPGTAVTGFPPGKVSGSIHSADTMASTAQTDLAAAIAQGQGLSNCVTTASGNLGGLSLGPGLYVSTSSLSITGAALTLNASGNPDKVFIFVMASTLTVGSGITVFLTGGAVMSHVFWIVGSSATLGTTSHIAGNILAHTSITLDTGAIVCGRVLANTGAVTMDDNRVTGTR
jgi:hypothetical protein